MNIVQCPYCSAAVGNDSTVAGKIVSCPVCQSQFRMPPLATTERKSDTAGSNSLDFHEKSEVPIVASKSHRNRGYSKTAKLIVASLAMIFIIGVAVCAWAVHYSREVSEAREREILRMAKRFKNDDDVDDRKEGTRSGKQKNADLANTQVTPLPKPDGPQPHLEKERVPDAATSFQQRISVFLVLTRDRPRIIQGGDGQWRRFRYVPYEVKHDVQTTNSLVSPFTSTLTYKLAQLGTRPHGTQQAAESDTNFDSTADEKTVHEHFRRFSFSKGAWQRLSAQRRWFGLFNRDWHDIPAGDDGHLLAIEDEAFANGR